MINGSIHYKKYSQVTVITQSDLPKISHDHIHHVSDAFATNYVRTGKLMHECY